MKSKNELIHDKNVEKVYAERAKVYGKANWTKDLKFIKTIIDFVDLKKNDLALEVGIGTGLLAKEVKKRVKDVYGIDVSKAMLAILPPEINKANIINMKAESMPYLDEVFDIVYWRSVIMHVIEPQKIIDESYRITKNNSRIFLVEPVEINNNDRNFIFTFINMKDDTHHYYFTEKDLYQRLTKAGFKNLQHTVHIEPTSFNSWITGGAVNQLKRKKLFNYLNNAPEKYKKLFNINKTADDIFFSIKWIILKGEKIC